MKRSAVTVLIMLSLLLTGCGTFMDGEFLWEQNHAFQPSPESGQNISVSDYDQLCDALIRCIEFGVEQVTISVVHYDRALLEMDIARAVDEVCQVNPVAAYAVQEITYELGTGGGEAVLALQFAYLHNKQEIKKIVTVADHNQAHTAIKTALNACESGIVLRIANYQEADFLQIVEDYAVTHPQYLMEMPQVTVNIYPDFGEDRVVELRFQYQTSRETLRGMQKQVRILVDAAVDIVSVTELASEKYAQMYSLLMERFQKYTIETSITPAYSLLVHGVGDSRTFAVVYAAMCREAGLECFVVTGTRAGEPWYWNIVCIEDQYFHLDLLRSKHEGAFLLLTDAIIDNGYVWDFTAYPQSPVPEEVEKPSEE
ncbi:MAG: transglutaminase domain-containing protein [Oscillospiraceae bacterium]|nr:transglutaminase domain-containing protein [Oscillospiraceae bacterium]